MKETIRPGASNRVTNDTVFGLLDGRIKETSRILDFGAGQGHMCERVGGLLKKKGLDPRTHLTACEITADSFLYEPVKCHAISTDSKIPFDPATFDLIYAIEVIEHTPRPYDFFLEAYDKLAPGGALIFTAPNILHMQSRLKFFFTGFSELYGPSSIQEKNAGRICGHIMPLSFANFRYGLKKAGFTAIDFHVDRRKRSAKFIASLFYPLLRFAAARYDKGLKRYDEEVWKENYGIASEVNSFDILTSRSAVILAVK